MANTHFIQWNCRGIRANYEELELLVAKYNPVALCLQELQVSDTYTPNNELYNLISKLPHIPTGHRPHGGAGILIRKDLPHSVIPLNTSIQAVACRVSTFQPITICSIYLPPSYSWKHTELLTLVSQLPPPILLRGDFNAHNSLWGCTDTNGKGLEVANFLLQSNLCLLNKTDTTYIHPATGTRSSIDLAMCDPTLFLDLTWNVHDDLCGSDHLPVVLSNSTSIPQPSAPRWNMHKADWGTFRLLCQEKLGYGTHNNATNPIENFSSTLLGIAAETIPKTSKQHHRQAVPWLNDSCKSAVAERKTCLQTFTKNPTNKNLSNLRVFRAKARRTIRENKRECWRSYVSQLNSQTPMKKIWQMIRRISGKADTAAISHLKVNNSTIEQPAEIADTLAATISHNSSSEHYTDGFRRFKTREEKKKIKFPSNNTESYNQPFSMAELCDAIHKAHDSATGPDNIHYQLLKNLPESALDTLLRAFNDSWTTGQFPPAWSEATIIPIPKPGKDPTDPGNYRPIALTSCLCKTFERLVNYRLVWFLEKNKIFTEYQSGFRKSRSTTDQLVRLESYIREAFVRREHVVSVFFDLEKAYDTTWKYGILRDLHEAGLRGRLPDFISKFLNERSFRVRVGLCFSDLYDQEMGVPQGAILSVALFILKINSIIKCLPVGVRGSLYVDDFCICFRSKSLIAIERQIQRCLNGIQKWADENGFQFSKSKTVCMHFSQLRSANAEPDLKLYGASIPVVNEFKLTNKQILGVIFDKKLTFKQHIRYLKDRCFKALNLLRVIAHKDWGADCATLLKLYRSHVRSKLDYGCVVYGSARKTVLETLDRVQNAALRTCLGAFRTSPVSSLHVEAGELPPELRRQQLSLQYIAKLRSNPSNPTFSCVFGTAFNRLFEARPHITPTLGIRMQQTVLDSGINLNSIARISTPGIPPWSLKAASFEFSLHLLGNKSEVTPNVYQTTFNELVSQYDGYTRIFTDGYQIGEAVGAAAIVGSQV